jgi:hypothetical protein
MILLDGEREIKLSEEAWACNRVRRTCGAARCPVLLEALTHRSPSNTGSDLLRSPMRGSSYLLSATHDVTGIPRCDAACAAAETLAARLLPRDVLC